MIKRLFVTKYFILAKTIDGVHFCLKMVLFTLDSQMMHSTKIQRNIFVFEIDTYRLYFIIGLSYDLRVGK